MEEITFAAPDWPNDYLPPWNEVPYFRLPTEPSWNDALSKRLIKETVDCLKIIDTSLRCYFGGDSHMFKPIATQLRMLYCDRYSGRDNALLTRLSPVIELLAFRPIQWQMAASDGMTLSMARAPYFVAKDEKGIHRAEINIDSPPRYMFRDEWLKQVVDLQPIEINIGEIISAVANKGGGAHVDSEEGVELSALKRNGPGNVTANEYFIIALARYTLRLGEQFTWNVMERGLLKEF